MEKFSPFATFLIGGTLVLAGCSSPEADPTVVESPDAGGATSTPAVTPSDPAESEGEPGGSGPDGLYLVGDVYNDGDFEFTYGGLAQTGFDTEGAYTDGECYFVMGTVERIEGPGAAIAGPDTFSPASSPIFAGVLDEDQNDEFFNCDFGAMTDAGFSQSVRTGLEVGDSADIWLDAVYVDPTRVGQLESVQLYGVNGPLFDAQVTQELSS